MAEQGPLSLWARRALFLAVAGVLILAGLVPLGTAPRAVPPPEALLALTLAWIARRPAEVPALSVAAVFVLADSCSCARRGCTRSWSSRGPSGCAPTPPDRASRCRNGAGPRP